MSRFRSLIHELHRRSIWQVLGIYLVGSWLGYQVIHALTDGLGLPAWVPPFAVVLFIIGLPIVLATAFVQEGGPTARPALPADPTLLPGIERFTDTNDAGTAEAGRAAGASSNARAAWAAGEAAPAGGASLLLTWRRALVGGLAAFMILGLSAGGYMGMRVAGIGPAGTLLGRGELTEQDRIVLADFGAIGADSLLAAAITDALRVDLEQSRAVSLVATDFVHAALQRMGQQDAARLPEPVARQLAQREGLKAVITGDIARVGGGFTINARVLRASDGEPLISARESARGEQDLLDAVDRLSRRLRERVGESLRSVRASDPLAHVTTGSLEALQLYSQASRLLTVGTSSDVNQAVQLLEQAIAIDPEFAMAYRSLGVASSNEIFDRARTVAMLTRAYELSDRLTERERLLTMATYHRSISGETERAIAAYEQVLARYPDELGAMNNLAIIVSEQGDEARAIELYRRILAQDTTRRISLTNLAVALIRNGRFDEAQAALDLSRRRFPDDAANDRYQTYIDIARGDLAAALQSAEAHYSRVRTPIARALAVGDIGVIHDHAGRPARSGAAIDDMLALLRQANAHETVSIITYFVARRRIEFYGEPPDRIVAEVEAAMRASDVESLPPAERAYPERARFYAAAGQPARAREARDHFAQQVVAPAGLRALSVELEMLDGELLVYAGRAAEGARVLRAAADRSTCQRCAMPVIGWAFDVAEMPDSAIEYYDRFLATQVTAGPIEFAWRTRTLARAAELHEAAGNAERARLYYARLLELWADPEPAFRPRVEEVRARLAGLMAG